VGDIMWGLFVTFCGVVLIHGNLLNIGLLGLGLGLIGIGVWILVRPSPVGMIFDGVILLLVSAWNFLIFGLVMMAPHPQPNVVLPIIAIAQVYWGFRRIRGYRRFSAAVAMQPSATTVKWLAGLVAETLKARPSAQAQSIDFIRQGGFRYERWKGRLLPEIGIFVMSTSRLGGRRDVILASKDGIEILSRKKKLLRKKFKTKLRLKDQTYTVVMPALSLERITNWLAASTDPAGGAAVSIATKQRASL
jgi:hypothetical protein